MGVTDVVVVTVAAAWVAATVLGHLPDEVLGPRLTQRLHAGVLAWLVPSWNFFAPVPGTHTYTLLYRDESPGGQLGSWREVPVAARRGWTRGLWNPSKTGSKAVLDLSLELARTVRATEHEPLLVRISMPYLTALALVDALPHAAGATGTQFLLLQRSPSESRVLHLSAVHSLATDPGSGVVVS
jgi:hypothetical protein